MYARVLYSYIQTLGKKKSDDLSTENVMFRVEKQSYIIIMLRVCTMRTINNILL